MASVVPSADITEQLYRELRDRAAWLRGQREALELAVNGASLKDTLAVLVRTACEALGDGTRAAFYLARDEGCTSLHHVVGMSDEYAAAVDGFQIGPESLACGLATHTGEPILTADVMEEPRWATWRWLAERYDYRGCWSFPIFTAAGKFIGTLTVYTQAPRAGSERERELGLLLTNTASIVIARHKEAEVRKRAEEERARVAAALRESEMRQSFLVRLNDSLRQLADPNEIKGEVCRVLAEELRADRTYYVEVDQERRLYIVEREYLRGDAPSVVGVHSMDPFPYALEGLLKGETLVVEDTGNDQRLSEGERLAYAALCIRSYMLVPIVKHGELVAVMSVTDVASRRWSGQEIALTEDASARAWEAVKRARAEAVVRESEARFRVVTELAPAMLSETDANGNRVSVNRQWLQYTGQTLDQARGWGWLDAIHPADRADTERVFRDAFASGQPLEREHRITRRDGDHRWFLVRQQPMRDEHGRVLRWLGVATDVHDQRVALAAAEEASRIKDEFLATLSHELRTPLAAILLWLSTLRSRAQADPELSRAIDAIAISTELQSRLVEDLLDLSRLSSGQLTLSTAPVDVGRALREAFEMVASAALAKRIDLTSDIACDIGVGVIDGVRLQQILANLLGNAIKFTPEGGAVRLRALRRGARLELEVADNGPGISAEFMPRLFDRFSQADMGHTRRHAGLGIGLALTRQLIELQGGTIEAESAGLGRGTLFRVRLPCEPAAAPAPQREQTPSRAPSKAPLASLQVLVVEDDPSTLEAMQRALAAAGATVIGVRTAARALAALSSGRRIDGIVADVGLPGTSGLELIARVVRDCQRAGREPPPLLRRQRLRPRERSSARHRRRLRYLSHEADHRRTPRGGGGRSARHRQCPARELGRAGGRGLGLRGEPGARSHELHFIVRAGTLELPPERVMGALVGELHQGLPPRHARQLHEEQRLDALPHARAWIGDRRERAGDGARVRIRWRSQLDSRLAELVDDLAERAVLRVQLEQPIFEIAPRRPARVTADGVVLGEQRREHAELVSLEGTTLGELD